MNQLRPWRQVKPSVANLIKEAKNWGIDLSLSKVKNTIKVLKTRKVTIECKYKHRRIGNGKDKQAPRTLSRRGKAF